MKIFCCFVVFLSIISSSTSSSYDQFLEILKKKFLDEEVDVEIWNQINENAIQQMPKVTDYSNEKQAFQWLNWYSRVRRRYQQVSALLNWNYETNISAYNQQIQTNQSLVFLQFIRLTQPILKHFNQYMQDSDDKDLRRIFHRLGSGGGGDDDDDDDETAKEGSDLQAKLLRIYSTTKVCEPNNPDKCYLLTPYLENLMQVEKDYDRLLWAWKGWHDNCGNAIRPSYLKFIDLINKNARDSGRKDVSESWVKAYDMGNATQFESIIEDIREKIMPLYKQLHAYVRGRLCELYKNRFDCNGPIPAHILGNMWAQQWQTRFDDLMPYPDSPLVNITTVLLEADISIHEFYKLGEDFFTSIGLYPMTSKFWSKSLFKQPKDRAVVCQPSAANMAYTDDYRVKICTQINDQYFYTIHHELGHVEYYMAYEKHQPILYRSGASPAFHEAIGDTIGMFAISPTHLVKLGFLDENDINDEYEINYLFRIALQKVAFIPFGYTLDKYRFLLFRDQIDHETELNAKWWSLRKQYGGIDPPVERHDPINFDPGAKYHVASNTPYFRYFIAHILQFQFYRALCRLQGDDERLHMCDIYGNKYVGKRFKQMLAMGNSKSWQDILERLTGENYLDPQAMLDYFQPLYKWLKKENKRRNYPIGWM